MINESLNQTTQVSNETIQLFGFQISQPETLIILIALYIVSIVILYCYINKKDPKRFNKLKKFINSYKYWVLLILFAGALPAIPGIIYGNAALGSFSIAIVSTLGIIVSLYKNRLDLLEERKKNEKKIKSERRENLEKYISEQKRTRENLIIQLKYDKTLEILNKMKNKIDDILLVYFNLNELPKTRATYTYLNLEDYLLLTLLIFIRPEIENAYLPKLIYSIYENFEKEYGKIPHVQVKEEDINPISEIINKSQDQANRNLEKHDKNGFIAIDIYLKHLDHIHEKFQNFQFKQEFMHFKGYNIPEGLILKVLFEILNVIKNNPVEQLIAHEYQNPRFNLEETRSIKEQLKEKREELNKLVNNQLKKQEKKE